VDGGNILPQPKAEIIRGTPETLSFYPCRSSVPRLFRLQLGLALPCNWTHGLRRGLYSYAASRLNIAIVLFWLNAECCLLSAP
jgi:hypothetical protein